MNPVEVPMYAASVLETAIESICEQIAELRDDINPHSFPTSNLAKGGQKSSPTDDFFSHLQSLSQLLGENTVLEAVQLMQSHGVRLLIDYGTDDARTREELQTSPENELASSHSTPTPNEDGHECSPVNDQQVDREQPLEGNDLTFSSALPSEDIEFLSASEDGATQEECGKVKLKKKTVPPRTAEEVEFLSETDESEGESGKTMTRKDGDPMLTTSDEIEHMSASDEGACAEPDEANNLTVETDSIHLPTTDEIGLDQCIGEEEAQNTTMKLESEDVRAVIPIEPTTNGSFSSAISPIERSQMEDLDEKNFPTKSEYPQSSHSSHHSRRSISLAILNSTTIRRTDERKCGKEIFEVSLAAYRPSKVYLYPGSNWCSCEYFNERVINKRSAFTCAHWLAVRLCESLDCTTVARVKRGYMADIEQNLTKYALAFS